MLDALGCSNGAAKDHGFGHHVPRWTGFGDLDGWLTIPTANATFRQIHQQRSPLHAPLTSSGEQGMKIREIANRWGEDPAQLHREFARARDEFKSALRAEIRFHGPEGTNVERQCELLLELLRD